MVPGILSKSPHPEKTKRSFSLPVSFRSKKIGIIFLSLAVVFTSLAVVFGWTLFEQKTKQVQNIELEKQMLALELVVTQDNLTQLQASYSALISEDQLVRNEHLQAEIKSIEQVFDEAVKSYESLLNLSGTVAQNQALYAKLSQVLDYLSKRNYSSASAELSVLDAEVAKRNLVVPTIAANVPAIQEAPSSGSRRQSVTTDFGTYQVDIIAADLNSTRVQVETASSGDCADNCPVASLADFVGRSGGFAGINGPYFCPAEYPSCAGKTNSFDTLLMNKAKVYFNSDNNVYSTVPAVIFTGSSARFVSQSLEWGRDTSVDAVIAAQPLLLLGGEIRFGGDGDPKKGSIGSRSFIGTKDSTVYIGVVRGATVAEVAHVLKAMGIQNALNLDSGGSTALFADGRYLAGPGRNTPFGIILVRK